MPPSRRRRLSPRDLHSTTNRPPAAAPASIHSSSSAQNPSSAESTTSKQTTPSPTKQKSPTKLRCKMPDCRNRMAHIIAGSCEECAKHFCSKHRLPEDHECSGMAELKDKAHQHNADRLWVEAMIRKRPWPTG